MENRSRRSRRGPAFEFADEMWLSYLQQLREARLAAQKDPVEKRAAANLIQQSQAESLLHRLSQELLEGRGLIKSYTKSYEYDEAVVLMWRGSIAKADRPDGPDEAEYFLIVGARENRLWVNERSLPQPTPDLLKRALLDACLRL